MDVIFYIQHNSESGSSTVNALNVIDFDTSINTNDAEQIYKLTEVCEFL